MSSTFEETLAAFVREQAGPDVLGEGDRVEIDTYPGDERYSFAVEVYIVHNGKRRTSPAITITAYGIEDFLRNLHRLAQGEVSQQPEQSAST